MKKVCIALVAVLIAAATLVPVASAAIEVSGDAYVSVNSMYLWRGFNLSEDDHFVVQPGTDLSVGGFTLSWWGNMSENTGELNEVDLTLDYSFNLNDLVSVSVGNIMYDVDNLPVDAEAVTKGTTNELYLGVGLNTVLSPALTVYYDYDEFEGNLFTVLSVGHTIELAEKIALNLGASGSYFAVDENFTGTGSDENFLHNAELSVGLDYALNDQVTISPLVLFSTPLSNDAEDITGIDDEIMAGVTFALNF